MKFQKLGIKLEATMITLTKAIYLELLESEKFRGNSINTNRSNLFWNCQNQYKLINLGFNGK